MRRSPTGTAARSADCARATRCARRSGAARPDAETATRRRRGATAIDAGLRRSPAAWRRHRPRGVKLLARALLIALLALAAIVLLALWLALSDRPALPPAPPWSLTELSRVKAVLGAELRRGNAREHVLSVTKRDLEIMLAQATRDFGAPRVDVDLTTGRARLRVSLALPGNPLGRWLDLDAQLNDADGLPGVDSLRIGALPNSVTSCPLTDTCPVAINCSALRREVIPAASMIFCRRSRAITFADEELCGKGT